MQISARIKMPDVTGGAAVGYWPAIWSLGDKFRSKYQNWPMAGEYDVMEVNFALSVVENSDYLIGRTSTASTKCGASFTVALLQVVRAK
jgi:beta-glucanase (GH16 family)